MKECTGEALTRWPGKFPHLTPRPGLFWISFPLPVRPHQPSSTTVCRLTTAFLPPSLTGSNTISGLIKSALCVRAYVCDMNYRSWGLRCFTKCCKAAKSCTISKAHIDPTEQLPVKNKEILYDLSFFYWYQSIFFDCECVFEDTEYNRSPLTSQYFDWYRMTAIVAQIWLKFNSRSTVFNRP